jgi:hypothetical protein
MVSLFLNITWSPLPVGTGSGTYEALPLVPTIETVTTVGVFPGFVGVEDELLPPPHRDAETAAARTARRIIDDRILLFLQ